MERRALRWQKLCPSQTPAWVTNFNATLTILSLQWPFKWQPLKIYTAEFCCSCFSISIISYSSCCSVQWLSSDPGVFPPPQPRPTSFSSLYSCKRLDCSSFAVWQMFLPLSSLYRKQTCEIFCIPELLVQMYLRVPLTWQTGQIIAVNHSTTHFGAVREGSAEVSGRRASHYLPVSVIVSWYQAECVACHASAGHVTANLPQDTETWDHRGRGKGLTCQLVW